MDQEILKQFAILIGSIGVTLSIFFAILLLRRKSKSNIFLAIYLLAFSLRIGKSLFHNYYDFSPTLRTYILSLMFSIGPSIWLFSKYLANQSSSFNKKELLHYALFLILLPICWFIPNDGSGASSFAIFYNGTMIHFFGYLAYSIVFYFEPNVKLAFSGREKVRVWWQRFLIANLIFIVWYALNSIGMVSFYMSITILYSLMIACLGFWSIQTPQLFSEPKEKYKDSNFSIEAGENLLNQVHELLKTEKLYLDPSLTLVKLSKRVNASPKEVSQAINQVEQINYAQFISKYRLEEAKRLLRSPDHSHYKIAAIAYESGFNSLSSFNSLFKKYTQSTAKAYRDSVKS